VETQLTGYYADITDWIVWVPSFRGGGYWEPLNVKKVISKGIEFSAKVKYARGPWRVTVNGNYALTRSLNYGDTKTWGDDSYGKQLVYIPVNSGNLFLHVKYKNSSITWQYNSYGHRYTTSSNDVSRTSSLPVYFMNQIYLGQEFRLGKIAFETQLKVYNLFNEYYRSVLGRRMPGRNYMLLLMFKF
jgi:iron complex outermembrane receptor protein